MFESIITYIYELVFPVWEYYSVVFYFTAKKVLKDLDTLVEEYGGAKND